MAAREAVGHLAGLQAQAPLAPRDAIAAEGEILPDFAAPAAPGRDVRFAQVS
jgi:hypothetical protein